MPRSGISDSVTATRPGDIAFEHGASTIRLSGHWTTPFLAGLEPRCVNISIPAAGALTIDAKSLSALDTGGAWLLLVLLERLKAQGIAPRLEGLGKEYQDLMDLIQERLSNSSAPPPVTKLPLLAEIGRRAWVYIEEALGFLAFIGEASVAFARTLAAPRRIRWSALFSSIEQAGVGAIPIICLLSFLLGIVIAYQGGIQLKTYGANIFIVELVTLTMIREIAPMMTAVIIAGRTGSAYTAEIGTMKVTEEIDALRTIGIGPMDLLVLPKVFGLMVALPLLTLLADALGVFGGMVMASTMLGVSYHDFIDRIPGVMLILSSFLIGIGKAPVFAMIVALMGCFQGFQVAGGAESVGRQTTVSVVQSIFLVIVADAAFSILFGWLGI
jgi:phospholipid/cholesterol/gamma-HCH transport system permease protein